MSSRNPRRSATQWAAIIAEYQAGAEDEAAFCQRHQLNRLTFRKHKYANNKTPRQTVKPSGFKEVRLPITPRECITVHAHGVRVDVPVSMDMIAVAQLVKTLVSASFSPVIEMFHVLCWRCCYGAR